MSDTGQQHPANWYPDPFGRHEHRYWDGTQWRDSWDSTIADPTTGLTNMLPQAIKVQIQLAAPQSTARAFAAVAPIELVVPVTVQAPTNRTAQASGG